MSSSLPPDLTPEERKLAAALEAMEKTRAYARTAGDWIKLSEVDGWFKEHAGVVRALRDKLEADEFDRPGS